MRKRFSWWRLLDTAIGIWIVFVIALAALVCIVSVFSALLNGVAGG